MVEIDPVKAEAKRKAEQKKGVLTFIAVSIGAIIVFGVIGGYSQLREPIKKDTAAESTASATPKPSFDNCADISKGLAKPFASTKAVLEGVKKGQYAGSERVRLEKASQDVEGIQGTITMRKCRDADKDRGTTIDAGIDAVKDALTVGPTKANAQSFLDTIIEADALR